MKIAAFTITYLLFFSMRVFSTNYYVSSSVGDDYRTGIQAQDPATPWRTIGKVNSSMEIFAPGDSVWFKRGDIFEGTTLWITKGGSSLYTRLTFSVYGK